jgi:hypothetical protein
MSFSRVARFAVFFAILVAGFMVSAQSNPSLSHIKKIYIDKMENNLDQYITSEISKQFHGSLEIVTDASRAEAIMKGVNIGAQNTTSATVNLLDPSGKVVLWSGTSGDRENKFLDMKHGGQQTVAAHLVRELKKAMQAK